MMGEHGIQGWCSIREGRVMLNGQLLHEATSPDFREVMRSTYKALGIDHAKFHKMDPLSKLAFLTAEVILGEAKRAGSFSEETALVFANHSSCIDSDRKYQQSLDDPGNEWPSPAVFVYTLPNICLGEISIRHQLFTESCFFIAKEFDPATMNRYADPLLQAGIAQQVLCAWVEKNDDHYTSFAYLLDRADPGTARDAMLLKTKKEQ